MQLVIALVLTSFAVLSSFIGGFAFGRAHLPGVRMFGLFMVAMAVYSAGYALEVHQTEIGALLLAIKFEYLGVAFIPGIWLVFALGFTLGERTPRWLTRAAFIIPVVTVILVLTIETHGLIYQDPRVETGGLFPGLAFEPGPWYVVNTLYMFIIPVASVILISRSAFGHGRRYLRQTAAMVLGSIIPLAVLALYVAHLIPPPIDPNPFAFMLTGIVFSFALFRLGFLEVVPVARQVALDAVSDAFFVFDSHDRLQDMNPAARRLPGAEAFREGSSIPVHGAMCEGLRGAISAAGTDHEFSLVHSDNTNRTYTATAYPVTERRWLSRTVKTIGSTVLVRDSTERARQVSELRLRAEKDALTGLMNRGAILESAQIAYERTEKSGGLSIAIVDIDHFKAVNDQFGHAAGDAVLRAFADLLGAEVRGRDQPGRFGGEEFLIVLPDTPSSAALRVMERLRVATEQMTIPWEADPIRITASFGVASRRAPFRESLDSIIAAADQALYEAKRGGRNRVVGG